MGFEGCTVALPLFFCSCRMLEPGLLQLGGQTAVPPVRSRTGWAGRACPPKSRTSRPKATAAPRVVPKVPDFASQRQRHSDHWQTCMFHGDCAAESKTSLMDRVNASSATAGKRAGFNCPGGTDSNRRPRRPARCCPLAPLRAHRLHLRCARTPHTTASCPAQRTTGCSQST